MGKKDFIEQYLTIKRGDIYLIDGVEYRGVRHSRVAIRRPDGKPVSVKRVYKAEDNALE